MSDLIRNAIRTPDGTVLISRTRHDMVSHKDSTNNCVYFVDGGLSYCRRSANGDEVDLCVYITDPHEAVREALIWGTAAGDLLKLRDMETSHIKAILNTHSEVINKNYKKAMETELEYRRKSLR